MITLPLLSFFLLLPIFSSPSREEKKPPIADLPPFSPPLPSPVSDIQVQQAPKTRRRTYRAHGRINPYQGGSYRPSSSSWIDPNAETWHFFVQDTPATSRLFSPPSPPRSPAPPKKLPHLARRFVFFFALLSTRRRKKKDVVLTSFSTQEKRQAAIEA